MNALRTVCFDYNIFLPTFPLDEMIVPELEQASTCHHRFTARLRNELDNKHPLAPIAIRILKLHPSETSSLGDFNNMTLIPGGRFLISSTNKDIVQLWDLGFTPDMLIIHKPLASVLVNDLDNAFELLVQPTSDGRGILLLTVSSPTE